MSVVMMQLNQKLTKVMPRRHLIRVFTQEKNTNLGLKRGESVCLKGAYFGELMITDIRTYNYRGRSHVIDTINTYNYSCKPQRLISLLSS